MTLDTTDTCTRSSSPRICTRRSLQRTLCRPSLVGHTLLVSPWAPTDFRGMRRSSVQGEHPQAGRQPGRDGFIEGTHIRYHALRFAC